MPDKAGQPSLRSKQVVVMRIDLVRIDVVTNMQMTHARVVEQAKVHREHFLLRPCRQAIEFDSKVARIAFSNVQARSRLSSQPMTFTESLSRVVRSSPRRTRRSEITSRASAQCLETAFTRTVGERSSARRARVSERYGSAAFGFGQDGDASRMGSHGVRDASSSCMLWIWSRTRESQRRTS